MKNVSVKMGPVQSEHIAQAVKDKLTKQYKQLDPILLMEKIKQLQNQLWQLAWSGDIISVIDECLSSNESLSINEVETRMYRKQPKTTKRRDYRTRVDPFHSVHDEIKFEIEIKPNITAKELLEKLMTKYPKKFYEGHTRTLQRRLSELRKEFDQRESKYQQLMISKKFMTTNPVESIL